MVGLCFLSYGISNTTSCSKMLRMSKISCSLCPLRVNLMVTFLFTSFWMFYPLIAYATYGFSLGLASIFAYSITLIHASDTILLYDPESIMALMVKPFALA